MENYDHILKTENIWCYWAIFLNVPKIQVSGRYQPQTVWVGPSRKLKLDFLNDTEMGTGRPQRVSGRVRRPEDSSGLAIRERRRQAQLCFIFATKLRLFE